MTSVGGFTAGDLVASLDLLGDRCVPGQHVEIIVPGLGQARLLVIVDPAIGIIVEVRAPPLHHRRRKSRLLLLFLIKNPIVVLVEDRHQLVGLRQDPGGGGPDAAGGIILGLLDI